MNLSIICETWHVRVFLYMQTEHSLVAKWGHFGSYFQLYGGVWELLEGYGYNQVQVWPAGFGLGTGESSLPMSLQR